MKPLSWLMSMLIATLSPFALASNVQKATFPLLTATPSP